MAASRRALEFAKKIHSLSGRDARRIAAAEGLAQLEELDATEVLNDLLGMVREGSRHARTTLRAVAEALTWMPEKMPHPKVLARLAKLQEFSAVARLFEQGSPVKEMNEDSAARADARTLPQAPLGRLKTQARLTRNPDELARLAMASDPSVVRNALLNPRLTESLVLRIAARRPARPEPLLEVWKSAKWGVRSQIRRALVFNPYFPPEVGAKIVPLLNLNDWKEIAADASVHELIREMAKALIQKDSQTV